MRMRRCLHLLAPCPCANTCHVSLSENWPLENRESRCGFDLGVLLVGGHSGDAGDAGAVQGAAELTLLLLFIIFIFI